MDTTNHAEVNSLSHGSYQSRRWSATCNFKCMEKNSSSYYLICMWDSYLWLRCPFSLSMPFLWDCAEFETKAIICSYYWDPERVQGNYQKKIGLQHCFFLFIYLLKGIDCCSKGYRKHWKPWCNLDNTILTAFSIGFIEPRQWWVLLCPGQSTCSKKVIAVSFLLECFLSWMDSCQTPLKTGTDLYTLKVYNLFKVLQILWHLHFWNKLRNITKNRSVFWHYTCFR